MPAAETPQRLFCGQLNQEVNREAREPFWHMPQASNSHYTQWMFISVVYLEQTSQTLALEMAFLDFCVGEGEVILLVAFYNLSAGCH